jgi:glycogen synthase
MKALFLTNEYPPHVYGGAGVHVEYQSRELSALMDVEVRCFGDQNSHKGWLKAKGFGFDDKAFTRTDKPLKSPLQALQRCVNFSAAPVDADLVHCHTWYSHLGGILISKAYGIPLVITTHSLEPLRPWKREQIGLGYEVSTWVEKTAMEMADCIIAVSEGMKEDVLKLFKVDPSRIKVIYNGIDTTEYRPVSSRRCFKKYGIDPKIPYVLFVGRMTRQKGIIHLVRAIRHLNESIQVVLCAGAPDTPEIAREIREGVEAARSERNRIVLIEEMVSKPTAIELYSNAAVFCCPSIYEPFGIINLEAMACGTPVVASAVGGIREVVVHEETGLLVPLDQYQESPFEPKDPERFSRDMAAAINRVMGDESLRRRMGAAARRRAEVKFSWCAIAQEVASTYRALLRRRGV